MTEEIEDQAPPGQSVEDDAESDTGIASRHGENDMAKKKTLRLANGRNGKGQFAPGNQYAAGRGNPHAAQVTAWRAALVESVSPEDIAKAVAVLVKAAHEGKAWALRELFDRCFGRAQQAIELSGEIDAGGQYSPSAAVVDLGEHFLEFLDERAERAK